MSKKPAVLTRRNVLSLAGVTAALAALPAASAAAGTVDVTSTSASLGLLPAFSPAVLNRSVLSNDQIVYAVYANMLAPIADDVVVSGQNLGWMQNYWWREQDSAPTNARSQEHIATLAYFLENKSPIAQYAGDANLSKRLHMAIDYTLNLQLSDGSLQENPNTLANPTDRMAATGFGLQAMAATYQNVKTDPAFADLLPRMRAYMYRAVNFGLDYRSTRWTTQINFANQWISVVSGAACAASAVGGLFGATIFKKVPEGLERCWKQAFTAAGHPIEAGGWDFAYSTQVSLGDLGTIYHLLPPSLQKSCTPLLVNMATAICRFSAKTVLFEPGSTTEAYVISGVNVRNFAYTFTPEIRTAWDMMSSARWLAPLVPQMSPLMAAKEDQDAWGNQWRTSTQPLSVLSAGDTSPARLLRIPGSPAPAAKAVREAQVGLAPYLVSNRYTDISNDVPAITASAATLVPRVVGFVRRPGYYAGLHYGNGNMIYTTHTAPRFGLIHLWTPDRGTVVSDYGQMLPADQSGMATHGASVGPLAESAQSLSLSLFDASGNPLDTSSASAVTGNFSLASNDSVYTTSKTRPADFATTLAFEDYKITRVTTLNSATTAGVFHLPLIVAPDDALALQDTATVTGAPLDTTAGQSHSVQKVSTQSAFTINGSQFSLVTGANLQGRKRVTIAFADANGPLTTIKVLPLKDSVLSSKKSRLHITVPFAGKITVTVWFQP